MNDYVRNEDEFLHVGANWERMYTIENRTLDTEHSTAVFKIRDRQGNLVCEAVCTVQPEGVLVQIPYEITQKIDKKITKAKYDLFLKMNEKSYKLIMGNIEIIHDISMH
jgi:hypothetical protein|nr:MAG TPA: hypothetical protein [Caudoviricetes sp.]